MNVIADAEIYLCEFHRKQAWKRWLRKKEHGIYKSDQEELYDMLEQLALCETEEEYNKALDAMFDSDLWQRYPNVQEYFNIHWRPKFKVLHGR